MFILLEYRRHFCRWIDLVFWRVLCYKIHVSFCLPFFCSHFLNWILNRQFIFCVYYMCINKQVRNYESPVSSLNNTFKQTSSKPYNGNTTLCFPSKRKTDSIYSISRSKYISVWCNQICVDVYVICVDIYVF